MPETRLVLHPSKYAKLVYEDSFGSGYPRDTVVEFSAQPAQLRLRWPDGTFTTETVEWDEDEHLGTLYHTPYITVRVHGCPLRANLLRMMRDSDRLQVWTVSRANEYEGQY